MFKCGSIDKDIIVKWLDLLTYIGEWWACSGNKRKRLGVCLIQEGIWVG
jgi:hypothetical protein